MIFGQHEEWNLKFQTYDQIFYSHLRIKLMLLMCLPYVCTGKPRICNVCSPRVNEGRSYVNLMQVDHLTHEINAHVRYLESTFGPTYVHVPTTVPVDSSCNTVVAVFHNSIQLPADWIIVLSLLLDRRMCTSRIAQQGTFDNLKSHWISYVLWVWAPQSWE